MPAGLGTGAEPGGQGTQGQAGASWAPEAASAWQGTKGQSVERPQVYQLIEEEKLARSLLGPCRGLGGRGGPLAS